MDISKQEVMAINELLRKKEKEVFNNNELIFLAVKCRYIFNIPLNDEQFNKKLQILSKNEIIQLLSWINSYAESGTMWKKVLLQMNNKLLNVELDGQEIVSENNFLSNDIITDLDMLNILRGLTLLIEEYNNEPVDNNMVDEIFADVINEEKELLTIIKMLVVEFNNKTIFDIVKKFDLSDSEVRYYLDLIIKAINCSENDAWTRDPGKEPLQLRSTHMKVCNMKNQLMQKAQ